MDKRLVLGIVVLGFVAIALVSPSIKETAVEVPDLPNNNFTIGVMSATETGDPYYRYLAGIAIDQPVLC